MKWAVQLLQSEFDNVPLALDTTNQKAIEAGISVYNRSKVNDRKLCRCWRQNFQYRPCSS